MYTSSDELALNSLLPVNMPNSLESQEHLALGFLESSMHELSESEGAHWLLDVKLCSAVRLHYKREEMVCYTEYSIV